MYRKILVAYDGSEGAGHALRAAVGLAGSTGAELVSLSVIEHLPYFPTAVDEVDEARERVDRFFRKITGEARALADSAGLRLEAVVRRGHEVETIVKFAKEGGFDLLVVGFTGHSNVLGRIMGGTVQNIVRHAPCPVLVVK
jgi:nucleotide-binding universal stress UspA family protein